MINDSIGQLISHLFIYISISEDQIGSVEYSPTATAASAAFPPSLRILWPAVAARGWVQDTIPLVLCTTLLLLGKGAKRGLGLGYTAFEFKGILADDSVLIEHYDGAAVIS